MYMYCRTAPAYVSGLGWASIVRKGTDHSGSLLCRCAVKGAHVRAVCGRKLHRYTEVFPSYLLPKNNNCSYRHVHVCKCRYIYICMYNVMCNLALREIMSQGTREAGATCRSKAKPGCAHLYLFGASAAPNGNERNTILQQQCSQLGRNRFFEARPATIHFSGFELGRRCSTKLKILNVSAMAQSLHLVVPQTQHFRVRKFSKRGRVAPGMASIGVYLQSDSNHFSLFRRKHY